MPVTLVKIDVEGAEIENAAWSHGDAGAPSTGRSHRAMIHGPSDRSGSFFPGATSATASTSCTRGCAGSGTSGSHSTIATSSFRCVPPPRSPNWPTGPRRARCRRAAPRAALVGRARAVVPADQIRVDAPALARAAELVDQARDRADHRVGRLDDVVRLDLQTGRGAIRIGDALRRLAGVRRDRIGPTSRSTLRSSCPNRGPASSRTQSTRVSIRPGHASPSDSRSWRRSTPTMSPSRGRSGGPVPSSRPR